MEGGCLCAAIRYRVTGVPVYSVICHCATCRKASGAPSVAWLTFEREHVEFLSGTARSYESSPGVTRRYCGDCGSPISYESAENPSTVDLTTLSLDDPTVFPPTAEVWLEHRVPWEAPNPALEPHPRGIVSGT